MNSIKAAKQSLILETIGISKRMPATSSARLYVMVYGLDFTKVTLSVVSGQSLLC